MKKHLSVFGFFARSSFFKVLLILLAMCAVEFTFFHFGLKDALEAYEVVGSGMPSLERMFMRAATNVYFRVALALITVVICLPGCEFKSKTSYTMRRLSISERATFFHQAAYNALVYLMLFGVQLVAVFGLSQYYLSVVPEECISNQSMFLAFYRNDFLHSLLPLEDVCLLSQAMPMLRPAPMKITAAATIRNAFMRPSEGILPPLMYARQLST